MNEFIELLTGNQGIAFNLAALFFILLGAFVNVVYDVQTRYILNRNSPVTFDWRYFFKDNQWRFGINLLMCVVVVRFFSEFTGIRLTMGYCFLIGLIFDAMFVVYRKLRKRMAILIDKYF